MPGARSATLREWRDLAPEVRHFEFETADDMPFEPGQFISLTEPLGGHAITRAYSLASAPGGRRFALCLNRVNDGHMSPHLFALRESDPISFSGPLGAFIVRRPERDRIYVATGTGIAPFRSMLAHQFAVGDPASVTLIFGVRYPETILYRDELERWEAARPNFTFRPTLSRPPVEWTGLRGHVQEHVLAAVGDRRDLDVYICGMKAMVDDLRARLKAAGLDRRQIVTEKYD
ncbi:MAG: FAD-dependent oxidoreductase [Bryobacteraceae bacterium]